MKDNIIKFLVAVFDPYAGAQILEQVCLFVGIGGLISVLFEGNHVWMWACNALVLIVMAWVLRSQLANFGDKK